MSAEIERGDLDQLSTEGGRAWETTTPEAFHQWVSSVLPRVNPDQWGRLLVQVVGCPQELHDGESSSASYPQATGHVISSLFQGEYITIGYQLLIFLLDWDAGATPVLDRQELAQDLAEIVAAKERNGKFKTAIEILEILLELDPYDTEILDKLVRHKGRQGDWSSIELYIQFFLERTTEKLSSDSEIQLEIGHRSNISLLAFLFRNNRHELFFDFFVGLIERSQIEDRGPFYAWLVTLIKGILPQHAQSLNGLWHPHHRLDPSALNMVQNLCMQAEGKGFYLMAQALEECAIAIKAGDIGRVDLSNELTYLGTLSDSMRYYSVSGHGEKVRMMMRGVLNHWTLDHLQDISSKVSKLVELKNISMTFLFSICNLLTYISDDRPQIRAYQQISGDLYSRYAKQKYQTLVSDFSVNQSLETKNPYRGVARAIPRKGIRVGYLGRCLRGHSVGYLSHQVIGSHNPDIVSTFCYQVGTRVDESDKIYQSFRDNAYCFRDLSGQSMASVIEQIRNDSLDILVFLDGLYVPDNNIIPALRVAPIQISWLGSDSPGLPEIDYCLVDPYLLPNTAQADYRERLIRLPNFLAVDSLNAARINVRRFRQLLDIPEGFVIFGSSAHAAKRSPECIDAQLEILRAVPQSVLLIKGVGDMDSIIQVYRDRLKDQDTNRRLRFMGIVETNERYRAQLSAWDLVLDTFPYTGATHTVEAIYMGVPVLTKVGEHYFGRMSYSILKQIDLDECICWSVEDYIAKGIQLGRYPEDLRRIKQQIQKSYSTSRLWDAARLSRYLEKVYKYLLEERPDHEVTDAHFPKT